MGRKKKKPSAFKPGCSMCKEGWLIFEEKGKRVAKRCICLLRAIDDSKREEPDEPVPF